MNGPTNLLGQPVKAGDIIALTTMSGKWSRTRVAKIARIEEIHYDRWDYSTKSKVPAVRHRVFARLYNKTRDYDCVTKTYGDFYLKPYTKEVFGVSQSVPVDVSMVSADILEVLK